jgi:hypothetical protein
VEDDLITAADGDDLPVTPAQRALGPPTVLEQPTLADAIYLAPFNGLRLPVVTCDDRHPPRHAEPPGTRGGVRLSLP